MLKVTLDKDKSLAIFEPHGNLTKEDFESAVKVIDPFIEEHGHLKGAVFYTEFFPGWKDFAALSKHLVFAKNHHKKIDRIAVVTDSIIAELGDHLVDHFISAEIKMFPFTGKDDAMDWVAEK